MLASRSTGPKILVHVLFEDMYKSFYWSKTQNSRLLILKQIFAPARTQGALNRKIVFCQSHLFEDLYKLFYWSKTQNRHLLILYIVTETHFRALRARGAREPKKVYDMIIFMPRRFQRAIARPNPTNGFQSPPHKTFIIIYYIVCILAPSC